MNEVLSLEDSLKFIKKVVPIVKTQVLTQPKTNLAFPFILKISSPDLHHKTEFGAVQKITNQPEFQKVFAHFLEIIKKNSFRKGAIIAQEYAAGIECILGIKNDMTFGKMLVFGLGGIYTEVFKDTATRKCPLTVQDVNEMIFELRSKKIFEGYRNQKVDLPSLKKAILVLSNFALKNPTIQELDINPLIVNEKGVCAVDARVVLQ